MRTKITTALIAAAVSVLSSTPGLALDCTYVDDPDLMSSRAARYVPFHYDVESGWVLTASNFKERSVDSESLIFLNMIAREFERRGSALAIVVPPPRSLFAPRIVSDRTRTRFDLINRETQIAEYSQLVEAYSRQGIVTPNIVTAWGDREDVYFQRDHHWTAQGSFMAAEVLHRDLVEAGIWDASRENGAYELAGTDSRSRRSSYARVFDSSCDQEFPNEDYEYQLVSQSSGREIEISDALFGDGSDETPSVLLLGTSYSAVTSRLYFPEYLSYWFQADVTNLGITAGGTTGSFLSYGRGAAGDLVPDLVIWELPIQSIQNRSDRFRQNLASMVPNCPVNSSSEIAIPLIPDTWSDWTTIPGGSDLAEIRIPDYVTGSVSITVRYADSETRRLKIEHGRDLASLDDMDTWKTYILATENGELTHTPTAIRVRADDMDEAGIAYFSGCADTGE